MDRSRNFAFTWNNYPESWFEDILKLSVKYLVGGEEIAESGTPHIQGHVVFTSQRTLKAAIKKLPGCHVSVARDVDASIEYCKKDGHFKEFGTHLSRSKNAQLQTIKRSERNKLLINTSIKKLVDDGEIAFTQVSLLAKAKNIYLSELLPYHHPGPRGVWVYGPPGTGKSYEARATYPEAYIKAQNKWWDGYHGQLAVIFDDADSDVMGHYLKIWTDEYPCSGEVKNGHVQLVYHVFYVTSNYSPEALFNKDPVMAAAIRRRCEVRQKNNHPFNGVPNMIGAPNMFHHDGSVHVPFIAPNPNSQV